MHRAQRGAHIVGDGIRKVLQFIDRLLKLSRALLDGGFEVVCVFAELSLGFLQGLLGTFPFRHIAGSAGDKFDFTIRIQHGAQDIFINSENAGERRFEGDFTFKRSPGFENLSDFAGVQFLVLLLIAELAGGFANNVRKLHAPDFEQPPIGVAEPAFPVKDVDEVRRGGGDAIEKSDLLLMAFNGPMQSIEGANAFGNVTAKTDNTKAAVRERDPSNSPFIGFGDILVGAMFDALGCFIGFTRFQGVAKDAREIVRVTLRPDNMHDLVEVAADEVGNVYEEGTSNAVDMADHEIRIHSERCERHILQEGLKLFAAMPERLVGVFLFLAVKLNG